MNAIVAAALDFARRNRIHIRWIAVIAAIHAALLIITWRGMVSHNLDNLFTQIFTLGFGSPVKETFFDHFNSTMAPILSQPAMSLADHLPASVDVPDAIGQVVACVFIALNSVLWGAAIYALFALARRTKGVYLMYLQIGPSG